ncbi:MAG: hypothetical protein KJ726_11620 [Verrucomicrobia bacterium]|nr:hypothetical protein [Verrucomicrobiota bacterium]MBU1910687.1 hypothetical protein [Verrucomicrobiota bacterium]
MTSASEASVPAPDVLLRLARGLSCVFWGIPLSLLLFSGALDFRLLPHLRLPAFVVGLLLVFCGVLYLHRVPPLTRRWPRRIQQALLILLVLVYLSPFVLWWRAMPQVPYYSANMLAMMVVTMWGFLVVNQVAAEVGLAFGDRTFSVEARLCGWLAVLFLLVPGLLAWGRSQLATAPLENSRMASLVLVPYLMPRWMMALMLLPFTLTMTMVWRAKELCLRAIRRPAQG